MLTFPKDTSQFSWTRHIKNKMVFYHLSGAQILRIFRKPTRREEGIAPQTVAAMQPRTANSAQLTANRRTGEGDSSVRKPSAVSSKRPSEEIWIMYKLNKKANGLQPTANRQPEGDSSGRQPSAVSSRLSSSRITMISAWRYPGVTKAGERPKIPDDVLEELEKGIY